jgi:hypothetical protein
MLCLPEDGQYFSREEEDGPEKKEKKDKEDEDAVKNPCS